MSIGTVVGIACERSGLPQNELGRRLNYSGQAISAWRTGERRVPTDVLPQLARVVDDPDLYRTISRETSGVGPQNLDGDYTDHTPAAVLEFLKSECLEAIERAEKAKVLLTKKPVSAWTPEETAAVADLRHHLTEAEQACSEALGMVCKASGVSLADEWARHDRELQQKGYVKTRRAAAAATATAR